MTVSTLKFSNETSLIIGCCMKIHTELGRGFPEVFYQRALVIELEEKNIQFEREFEMPVFYKERHIGTRKVDFLIDSKIAVELKATSTIEKSHLAQTLNYLETQNIEIGLLVNFGSTSLEFKRLYNQSFRDRSWMNTLYDNP